MRKAALPGFFLFLAIFLTACRKNIAPTKEDEQQLSSNTKTAQISASTGTTCREELQPRWIADTIDVATQLGYALVGNPYSVAVMRQAAINLHHAT